ncbi:MAG: hypothetical protein IIA07_07195 [Proteobacteria bacterium]|nr:hypothetical protein [Pseudomonadota bacterium]
MGVFNTYRDMVRDGQIKGLHRAIGEFVVEFEAITHQQWRCILWLLASAGLKDQDIVHILLADYTAEPMRVMLQSLIGHMRPTNADEEAIVKNLLDRHQKLISRRNDVIHGTWVIGYGNDQTTDWGTALGLKFSKNKKGANVKEFQYRVEDFEELRDEANALGQAFSRLSGCFTGGNAVEKNFDVADDGTVSVPE